MRLFILFELFLLIFTFYAILRYADGGGVKFVLLLLCLVTVFILEKLRKRRRFNRYPARLNAQYFLREDESDRKECTIFTIARKGMAIRFHTPEEIRFHTPEEIRFHTPEKIDVGSTIYVTIAVPQEPEPVMVKGQLRWIKQRKNDSICGIELTEVLDKDTFNKFRYFRSREGEERQQQSRKAMANV